MTAGKITLFGVIAGAVLSATTFAAYFQVLVPFSYADDVTTSVTVLNTPPQWTTFAHEQTESSTSTPTNAGARLYFEALGDDSNLDDYWLIICKTATAPTPNSNAAPTCSGGVGNQWAVSGQTVSGQIATAGTTTTETGQFVNESNDWYGWICDGNITLPQCNLTYTNSTGPTDGSPFVINHPPVFTAVVNDGPKDPGQLLTWTATATDTDMIRGGDILTLYTCKAASFSTSTKCGSAGAWATTSITYYINPTATSSIPIPTQDRLYNAYAYLVDNYSLAATSSTQGTNSSYTVNNVAPSLDGSTMSLLGTSTGNLLLTVPNGESPSFRVTMTVTDNNSCLNASSGNEIASIATTSVYRSGLTQSSCRIGTDYNTNRCYVSENTSTVFTCTQDVGTCSGASDPIVDWTCTFSFWYNADPTDAGAFYVAENWLASAIAKDDNGWVSTFTETQTGNEMLSFLAFNVSQTSISYGGLQPGQLIDPLSIATTTDLLAWGNVGLDENLYGDTMCTNWSGADTCDTKHPLPAATSTIPVNNQKFATSTVAYAAATALTSSSSPTFFALNVPKTTSTTSPQSRDTLWAINIPVAITLAGSYSGQNTIIAAKSSSAFW